MMPVTAHEAGLLLQYHILCSAVELDTFHLEA
jgi:hypothetical protein